MIILAVIKYNICSAEREFYMFSVAMLEWWMVLFSCDLGRLVYQKIKTKMH